MKTLEFVVCKLLLGFLITSVLPANSAMAQQSENTIDGKERDAIVAITTKKSRNTLELQIEFIDRICSLDGSQKRRLNRIADSISENLAKSTVQSIESELGQWSGTLKKLAPKANISVALDPELKWGIASFAAGKQWDKLLEDVLTLAQQKRLAEANQNQKKRQRDSVRQFVVSSLEMQLRLSPQQAEKVTQLVAGSINDKAIQKFSTDFQVNPLQATKQISNHEMEQILSKSQLARWKEIRKANRR